MLLGGAQVASPAGSRGEVLIGAATGNRAALMLVNRAITGGFGATTTCPARTGRGGGGEVPQASSQTSPFPIRC